MPIQKACEECGASFTTKPCLKDRSRFCSTRCKMVEQNRRLIAEGRKFYPRKPRRGTETPCPVCGAAVYRSRAERERGVGVYCSRKCQGEAQSKPPVVKNCLLCGKEIRLRPSQASIRFCSKRCEGNAKIRRPLERQHNGRPARLDQYGYVMLWEPDHPGAFHGWVREHRFVAEQLLGRRLEPEEEVHHLNGDKGDNRPENLQVLGKNEHCTLTGTETWDRVRRDREELEEYRRRFGALE